MCAQPRGGLMKHGDLVARVRRDAGPPAGLTLFTNPPVFRSDPTGKARDGELYLVVATMEYLSSPDFFVRLTGPGGTGWAGSMHFYVVFPFQPFMVDPT